MTKVLYLTGKKKLKVTCKLKPHGAYKYLDRIIISKVLKHEENYQYKYAMTKPLPTGCMKEKTPPTWKKSYYLLEKVSLEFKIGHMYRSKPESCKCTKKTQLTQLC